MAGNEKPSLCGPCGGACCKAGPGIVDPKDADAAALVKSGRFKVGIAGTVLFVAPATVDADQDSAIDFASPSRPCALLTSTGCSLSWKERPRQCQDLVARPPRQHFFDIGCSTSEPQEFYENLWMPHQAKLLALLSPRDREVVESLIRTPAAGK